MAPPPPTAKGSRPRGARGSHQREVVMLQMPGFGLTGAGPRLASVTFTGGPSTAPVSTNNLILRPCTELGARTNQGQQLVMVGAVFDLPGEQVDWAPYEMVTIKDKTDHVIASRRHPGLLSSQRLSHSTPTGTPITSVWCRYLLDLDSPLPPPTSPFRDSPQRAADAIVTAAQAQLRRRHVPRPLTIETRRETIKRLSEPYGIKPNHISDVVLYAALGDLDEAKRNLRPVVGSTSTDRRVSRSIVSDSTLLSTKENREIFDTYEDVVLARECQRVVAKDESESLLRDIGVTRDDALRALDILVESCIDDLVDTLTEVALKKGLAVSLDSSSDSARADMQPGKRRPLPRLEP